MDTLEDLRTAVQADLNVGSESNFYSPTAIDLAINRAYRKAAGLFPWPELQDAKKTETVADQEWYEYPSNWRSNSVWKLMVDDERYGEDPDGSPLSFDDYLLWKEDYPNSTDKKWSNEQRRYFIFPVPTESELEICVWGIKVVTLLSDDDDVTVFSYSTPEINEAIVLEAVAILKAKTDNDKGAEFRSAEAKQILSTSWNKIRQEKGKYEKNMPMWNTRDWFGKNPNAGIDMRGRF